ncbi:MAG: CorA family divalent cation transporter [Lachnospira sp.]
MVIPENESILNIMDLEEFKRQNNKFPHLNEFTNSLNAVRYCKMEIFKECILGTIRVPQKSEQRNPLITFGFYIREDKLYLIDDTGELKRWIKKQMGKLQELKSPDYVLLQILEQMIEDDILYLSHLEKEMEIMEEGLLHEIPEKFFSKLTKYRQKFSEFNAYYAELTAIGDLIQSHDLISNYDNTELWNRFTLRTERLQNHVNLLRENVLQLRELYQSQQDAKQNKIMCMLTVVTTLFLPLTLLTGWYGMNFAYMPELQWKYGYITVIAIAVVIVILEIMYFKKKKFF